MTDALTYPFVTKAERDFIRSKFRSGVLYNQLIHDLLDALEAEQNNAASALEQGQQHMAAALAVIKEYLGDHLVPGIGIGSILKSISNLIEKSKPLENVYLLINENMEGTNFRGIYADRQIAEERAKKWNAQELEDSRTLGLTPEEEEFSAGWNCVEVREVKMNSDTMPAPYRPHDESIIL